jgi:hypothetical protein
MITMDNNDIGDLLPFFVAGTLKPDESRRVEEALATSEELRKELQFWKRAQEVVAARQAESVAGHLTSKQIVDRALGVLTGDELLPVDNHLRSCPACSEELTLLSQSLETKQGGFITWSNRLSSLIRSIRFVYAVPAFAAAVAIFILIFGHSDEQPMPPSAKDIIPPVLAENQQLDQRTTSVWLRYRPKLRSAAQVDLPVLTLDDKDTLLQMFISVPHNSVSGIRYRVSVLSNGKEQYHLQDLVGRYASGVKCDSLRFLLSRDVLALPGRTTTLAISEVLPKELNVLTPEAYTIEFVIRAKHR